MKTSIIKWKLSAPLWTSDIMHIFPCVQMGEWDVEEPFCDITKDLFPQFYTLHIFWKGELEKIVSGLVNCEVFSRYTHCFWESIDEVHGMGPFCSLIMKSLNLCFQHLFAGLFQIKFRFKIHISNVQCHQFPIWDVFLFCFCKTKMYVLLLFITGLYFGLVPTGVF